MKCGSANIDDHTIISENKNELLGIILDSKLSFEDHINNLCKKASQKLNALARIAPYMCLEKRKTVMKAYVASQFGYCPLVWMFHSRSLNNKINSLHERALRITYGDRSSSFEDLLKKDNSVSIHHRNIQALATEMFKVENNIAPENLSVKSMSKICVAWHWIGVLSRSKNMGFTTQWNKRIWISQWFQIQNQKMVPWRMST